MFGEKLGCFPLGGTRWSLMGERADGRANRQADGLRGEGGREGTGTGTRERRREKGKREKRRERKRERKRSTARQNVTIRLRPRSDTNCALLIVADGGRLGRAEALADSALPHPSSASPPLSLSLPHGPPRVPVLFLPSPAPRVVRTTPTQRNARPPALLRLSPR